MVFFHFTFLSTYYLLFDSLLPSYEDLGPFCIVLAPFGFIYFPFLAEAGLWLSVLIFGIFRTYSHFHLDASDISVSTQTGL